MKTKDILLSITMTLILSMLLFFIGAKKETLAAPVDVYEVYLNGESIGYLNSEDEFLKLVDNKQNEIKNKYKVDKVYPPSGLVIEKVSTYHENILTSEQVYNIIEHKNPFTIDGYAVTIKYKDENKKPITIYALKKDYFEDAFYNTVAAFVGTTELQAYKDNTQEEITDVGKLIDSIYWEEEVTIRKAYISTEEQIFTNSNDLSQYMLFGTTEKQKTYIVKDGDSIDDIIDKNNLSIEEFLIANPTIPSQNILLTKNQEVSIGLISPLINVVHEVEVVEDITNKYTTEYKEDSSLYYGTQKVLQEGSNGLSRVTERIQYKNGAVEQLYITKSEEISPAINKIVVRGTKSYSSGENYINTGNEEWYWPTVSPYVITSRFGWRWGKHHNGIDISGTGFGSPIYSATDGVVVATNNTCPNQGYYGSRCGQSWGNYIRVSYNEGKYTIIYAHITKELKVKVGDKVTRGKQIGYMGNSGSSTGTHLHFAILDQNNHYLNPCKAAFSC